MTYFLQWNVLPTIKVVHIAVKLFKVNNSTTKSLSVTSYFVTFVFCVVYLEDVPEAHLTLQQTCKMKIYAITVNGWKLLAIVVSCSILDVCRSSGYLCALFLYAIELTQHANKQRP